MAYPNPFKIANGAVLDFIVQTAENTADALMFINSDGELVKASSLPASRVSSGGNLTEATSSVLTITGGTGSVLSNLSIQVKQAATGQSGYLSSTDWNTFNNKLTGGLTDGYIFVGNASNLAVGVAMSGDVLITNAGVTSIASNVIVNSDINSTAAIAHTKMAALSASLVMATNGSGFATTVAGLTTTIAGYLVNISSDVQAQFAGKLSVTLTSPTNGDVITYNGSAWVNSPTPTGVPVGGTAGQFLNKIDGTNYNTQWSTLVLALVTDVTASATEMNQLTGVTTTQAQYQYLNTLSSNVQTQFSNKLDRSLAQNAIFVGNASNVPAALAAGTEGYVLTITAGVPTWSLVTGTGTVTSIDVSGGTTGLTTSGGPVSTTGTITLAGTVNVTHGGTGLSSLGSANRILGVNNAGAAMEYKTVSNGLISASGTFKWGGTLTGQTNIDGAVDVLFGDNTPLSNWDLITTGHVSLEAGVNNINIDSGVGIGIGGVSSLTFYNPALSFKYSLISSAIVANRNITIPLLGANDTFVFEAFAQSLINKTLGTGTKVLIGSDATGDIYYNGGSGALTRLGVGSNTQVLTLSGGVPTWAAPSGGSGITVGTTTITSGTSTRIPFNDGGVYGEDGYLTWDKTNKSLYFGTTARVHSTGTSNLFIGNVAGNFTTTGSGENVSVGELTLSILTTGTSNTIVGSSSGVSVTQGSNNTFIGKSSGANVTTGSGNIVIGYGIDAQSATLNNQLSIANSIFGSSNSATGTTLSTGNLGFFATSWGTSASKVLSWGVGTAPSTSPADMIQLYVVDVAASAELQVRDEAGNVTTLSPHNFSLIPEGPSEDMAWAHYSEKNGRKINVDMLKLARHIEQLTGDKLVYEA